MKLLTHKVWLTAVLLVLVAQSAFAAGITIAWDPSGGTDTAGYVVKYGDQPHGYGAQVDVGAATTFTVDGLVEGRTYYFTVQAYAVDGTVSAMASELSATAANRAATLVAPIDGQANVTSAQVFEWTSVVQAQAYVFQLGTTPGAHDIADSGPTLRTWWTVPALPSGTRLYGQVSTRLADTWITRSITFVSATPSMLIYPTAGTSDTSATETFSWTGVTDARSYRLAVGTTPGGTDLLDTGETTATTVAVNGLAPGQTLYAQLSTRLRDTSALDAVTFTTSFAARFTPSMAGDGAALGQGIGWTTILGADAYRVTVGSVAGEADLLDSGELQKTRYETPALPAGQPLFARVATKFGGEWRQTDATVTLSGAALMAPFADAAGLAAVTAAGQRFTWTTISNAAAYRLYVGTASGANDLFDSGEIHETSAAVPHLPIGTIVYVSIWTKVGDRWDGSASSFGSK